MTPDGVKDRCWEKELHSKKQDRGKVGNGRTEWGRAWWLVINRKMLQSTLYTLQNIKSIIHRIISIISWTCLIVDNYGGNVWPTPVVDFLYLLYSTTKSNLIPNVGSKFSFISLITSFSVNLKFEP